jgi:hypothetical protein
MKKVLLAVALFVLAVGLSTSAFAQKKKGDTNFGKTGTILVGGKVGFDSKTQEYDGTETGTSKSIDFEPMVGYFVIDGLAISVVPMYTSESQKPEGGKETTTSGFGIGVDARYFYKAMGTLFVDGGASFGYMSGSTETDGSSVDVSGTDIKLSVGGLLSFGKRWGGFGALNIGYEMQTMKADVSGAKDQTDNGIFAETMFGVFF